MYISGRIFTITITSIFLSLGIGIFMGAVLSNDMILSDKQEMIVKDLEREFHNLRNENRNYQENLKHIQEELFETNSKWEDLGKHFIENQLKEKKITLISRKNNVGIDIIKYWVELSGASVNMVLLNDKFFLISPTDEESGIKAVFASSIADVIRTAERNLTMDFYESQGLLSIQGPFDRRTDYTLLLNDGLPPQLRNTLEEYGLQTLVMDISGKTITSIEVITLLKGLMAHENFDNYTGI